MHTVPITAIRFLSKAKPAAVSESPTYPVALHDSKSFRCARPRAHPHFVAAHIGEPCTLGALDHHLDCGHKISTDQPEPCAKNCERAPADFVNPRAEGKPFTCMTCIISEVKRKHDEKVTSFQDDLQAFAKASKKSLAREEIVRRLEIMEIGWQELDLAEIRRGVLSGRWSNPFYVEPEYQEAVETVSKEQSRPDCGKDESTSSNNSDANVSTMPSTVSLESRSGASSRSSLSSLDLSWNSGQRTSMRSGLPVRNK